MRLYNSFIIVLALAFTAITLLLSVYNVNTLGLYYSAYTLALLVMVSLYTYFSPKARKALNAVSLLAFAGFGIILVIKVAEIL